MRPKLAPVAVSVPVDAPPQSATVIRAARWDGSGSSRVHRAGRRAGQNLAVVHGVGVSNEYPLVLNRELFGTDGYDGVVEPGMVLCVESLVAPAGRPEAVKLEEQVLITETGTEVLSAYPFCEELLD